MCPARPPLIDCDTIRVVTDELDSPIVLFPSPTCPLTPEWVSTFKPNNLNGWKPMTTQKRTPLTAEVFQQRMGNDEADDHNMKKPNLDRMERELQLMVTAEPRSIIRRLRGSWGDSRDARLYRELDMEKRRWMLSALHNMDQTVASATSAHRRYRFGEDCPQRILALYETQGANPLVPVSH
jgi:hypothetical protein